MSLDEDEGSSGGSRIPNRLGAMAVVEVIAVAIAVVEPLTPSKTGSKWSPAELVVADPGYLAKVLASFIAVNVLLTILGVITWIVARVRTPD